jgi:hypothetical protein
LNEYFLDLEEVDFADEMIRAIEKDYGRSIARIAKFQRVDFNAFEIIIVFADFKVLDAIIEVFYFQENMPSIQVQGTYY